MVSLKNNEISNLNNLLHSTYRCENDCEEKTHGVYLRKKPHSNTVKIGVAYANKRKITRSNSTNDLDNLNNLDFIPCNNESDAYLLEASLHYINGKPNDNKVRGKSGKAMSDVIPRLKDVNINKSHVTKEFFSWDALCNNKDASCNDNDLIANFKKDIETITTHKNVGKSPFLSPRFYQETANDRIVDAHTLGVRDFYLLMKMRSGKNCTTLSALASIKKSYTQPILINFLSLYPSAFTGLKDDIDKYDFGCSMRWVDTSDNAYEEEIENYKNSNIDIIIRLSSIQSLKECNDNEVDHKKTQYFIDNQADITIVDETDYGSRTIRSSNIIKEITNKSKFNIWMSGTDFYAKENLLNDHNHYEWGIIDEEEAVREGKIDMPLPIFYSSEPAQLHSMSVDDMTVNGMTNHISNIFNTSKNGNFEREDQVIGIWKSGAKRNLHH